MPVSERSASVPANTGPTVKPTPDTVVAAASAPARRSSVSESESQAAPAPHIVPNARPNIARDSISDQNSSARPWPSVESVKSTADAIVTRRAPTRSASRPKGNAMTRAARLAADRIIPVSTGERWSSAANVGASGTIAIQTSVSSRTSA